MTDKEKLEKLKKLADAMYYASQYLTTDASRLHKSMDEYRKFIIHEWREEPVSEKKCMFTKDSYTNEDRKVLCEDCKEKCEYNKKEEPASEELGEYINKLSKQFPEVSFAKLSRIAVRVAKWQKQQDQSTIELAEEHAYFAGRTKTIDEIKESLLSEVLPCFMHGGEADEVVAKLDDVLNQKK